VIGNVTLTRFFSLHAFVLPGLVILLVVVHLYLFRVHGVTPPWWLPDAQLQARAEPFWPGQVCKDCVLALVFLVGLGTWCYFKPAPLEAQADPSQPYAARPEWYFMFLFQLLRYFHGPYEVVGTFYLPVLFFLVLFLWPFLDRNHQRSPWRRPVAMALLGGGTASLVGLTIFAVATDVRMHEPALAEKQDAAATEPAGPLQRADVAKLYNTNCAACHGIDGSGNQLRASMRTLPDFTSMAWQSSRHELEITHRIFDGNVPLMPAYRDKLSEQQILALAIYVRAFSVIPIEPATEKPAGSTPPPAPVAAQMEPIQIYRTYCLSCHDANGTGNTLRKAMPDIPDFTVKDWWQKKKSNDADLKSAILNGNKGKDKTKFFMPPMDDKLGPGDAEQLVTFLKGFADEQVVKLEPDKMPVTPPELPPVSSGSQGSGTAKPDEENAARLRVASVLYRQYCLSCHGTNGRGVEMRVTMKGIPDFTSSTWQAGVSNERLRASILEGSPKSPLMPAFRGRIDEHQAKALVAFIRAFGPGLPTPEPEGADDFESRFRALEEQWKELQRQMNELSKPPK
jgi:mono/diheme cytochrome c family protein